MVVTFYLRYVPAFNNVHILRDPWKNAKILFLRFFKHPGLAQWKNKKFHFSQEGKKEIFSLNSWPMKKWKVYLSTNKKQDQVVNKFELLNHSTEGLYTKEF